MMWPFVTKHLPVVFSHAWCKNKGWAARYFSHPLFWWQRCNSIQEKNVSLFHHQLIFEWKVTWNFFGTSSWKSICDVVGMFWNPWQHKLVYNVKRFCHYNSCMSVLARMLIALSFSASLKGQQLTWLKLSSELIQYLGHRLLIALYLFMQCI